MTEQLFPTWVLGDIDLTYEPFSVDRDSSVDIGEPEMVVEGIESVFGDGDSERIVRYGNRAYKVDIYIEGPTLADIAESEALLRAEMRRTGLLLTHNPGDGWSATSVYEVQTARLTPARRDDHESHLIRKFTLTLTCSPFARSVNPSVTIALPADLAPSTIVIDTCSATTGWTQRPSGSTALLDGGSGSVYVLSPTRTLRRTGAVDFTSNRYLRVEWLASAGWPLLGLRTNLDAADRVRRPVSTAPQAGGWMSSTFDLDGITAGALDFTVSHAPGYDGPLYIRQVESTNVPPSITPRQTRRSVAVGGTERTPGSLAIKANVPPSEVLGMTIVHTAPDSGSAFPLRQWRVGGNTQTPMDNMSGFVEPLNTTAVFDSRVWASHITPGNYLLGIRFTASAIGTFRIPWTVATLDDATTQSYGIHSGTTTFYYDALNVYRWVPLGIVPAPTVRTASGSGHSIRVTLEGHASNPSVPAFDEAWLFRGGDGCALTVVTDVPDYLWLNSADLGDGTPTILEGNNADGSGARYPIGKVRSQGAHEFTPDTTHAFVATESQYPLVDFTHFHRWHSNAADEGGEVD